MHVQPFKNKLSKLLQDAKDRRDSPKNILDWYGVDPQAKIVPTTNLTGRDGRKAMQELPKRIKPYANAILEATEMSKLMQVRDMPSLDAFEQMAAATILTRVGLTELDPTPVGLGVVKNAQKEEL